jgi:hypothetical protein
MGILKGRSCSLIGLGAQIQQKKDTLKVNKWIIACLILLNVVTKLNDTWGDENGMNEDNEEYERTEKLK